MILYKPAGYIYQNVVIGHLSSCARSHGAGPPPAGLPGLAQRHARHPDVLTAVAVWVIAAVGAASDAALPVLASLATAIYLVVALAFRARHPGLACGMRAGISRCGVRAEIRD